MDESRVKTMSKTRYRITIRWLNLLPVAGLATILLVAGCSHADFAEQQVTMRGEHLSKTVEAIVKSERRRPRQLARTADTIRATVSRDTNASRANIDEIRGYWKRDCNRWIERQPVYREKAREILGGDPERIERNAIILFF